MSLTPLAWRLGALGAVLAAFLLLSLFAWREHDNAVAQRARADKQEARANGLEDARTKDQKAALGDYNQLQADCRTDMIAAIGKGRTIERILTSPLPADGGPAIIGADQLRDLTGRH